MSLLIDSDPSPPKGLADQNLPVVQMTCVNAVEAINLAVSGNTKDDRVIVWIPADDKRRAVERQNHSVQ